MIGKVTTPAIVDLTAPLIFENLPKGAIIDLTAYHLRAAVAMQSLVWVRSFSATPQNPNAANMFVTVKLGILEANGLAVHGLHVEGTVDSVIEVGMVSSANGDGVWLDGGTFMCANNLIRIGAIIGCYANGLTMSTATNDGTYNVQGNHITVGQVINNAGTGIYAGPGAFANRIEAGPLEHNGGAGHVDHSGGTGWGANIWNVNGENSNGS